MITKSLGSGIKSLSCWPCDVILLLTPLELLDVGGSQSHQNSRHVFYNNFHGIVLVHDLTNRKSQLNLEKWLAEVFQRFGLFTSIVL